MDDTRQNVSPLGSEFSESKIPSAMAEQIRRLSHDLSNALEVVLQTNYLLGMTDTAGNEDSRKWRAMLDQGVMQATQINRQLREYVRAHS
jgi:translation initiation factor 2 beta subunit (eIF-2beta)/eIF-5